MLEIHTPDHTLGEYYLGPHEPRLRQQDLELLHKTWLELSADPEFASLHHYHLVGLALVRLYERLHGPQRDEILALLRKELKKPEQDGKPN